MRAAKRAIFAWSPDENARYLIKTNAGDEFLERFEVGKWEAVKLHFFWTRARQAAQRFTRKELSEVFQHVVQGFSGPGIELA